LNKEALNVYGMFDCNPFSTPAAPGTKLYETVPTDDSADASTYPFQSEVGGLYLLRILR